MTQDNALPVLGGLAMMGVSLAVLLQAPAVRNACRRILQDPEITEACREVVARMVARSSHPAVGTA
jgi:hypothetical protein